MMRRFGFLMLIPACACLGEVHTLTLREAVDLALKQNPDVVLARLDEQRAEQAVRLAKDPFAPKVVVGSGLAYSSGFPMSIEGATPSIMQASAIAEVYNRPQSLRVASAREGRRGAGIDAAARQDEVMYRTADLFVETERAGKAAGVARRELDGLASVLEAVRARVAEGRELPIEIRKAELELARARYRAQTLEDGVRAAQTALAIVVGLEADDQVRPAAGERALLPLPESAEAAVSQALEGSKEIRSLESRLLAKGYDVRAQRAARLPRLDLVAQYGLLARFNHYEDFFRKFQRHNGQLGISFQVPLWSGPGVAASVSQAEAEVAQLQIQLRHARGRIAADTRAGYDNLRQAEAAQELARLDLEVAREQVSLLLAQSQEGRAALRQLEEARIGETDKWLAFYEAGASLERARLNLLRLTGGLAAALR
ncbi:MAG: TolC family protein [Bryobacteraceae bacterium]|jgi:outer membrane protein TolC